MTPDDLIDAAFGSADVQLPFDSNRRWKVVKGTSRNELIQDPQTFLSERQGKALGYLLQNGKLTIQDFESICPDVNRRSLQRDLKGMLDKKLVTTEGATNQLVYILLV